MSKIFVRRNQLKHNYTINNNFFLNFTDFNKCENAIKINVLIKFEKKKIVDDMISVININLLLNFKAIEFSYDK